MISRTIHCPECGREVEEWISADGAVHCRVKGKGWVKHSQPEAKP